MEITIINLALTKTSQVNTLNYQYPESWAVRIEPNDIHRC